MVYFARMGKSQTCNIICWMCCSVIHRSGSNGKSYNCRFGQLCTDISWPRAFDTELTDCSQTDQLPSWICHWNLSTESLAIGLFSIWMQQPYRKAALQILGVHIPVPTSKTCLPPSILFVDLFPLGGSCKTLLTYCQSTPVDMKVRLKVPEKCSSAVQLSFQGHRYSMLMLWLDFSLFLYSHVFLHTPPLTMLRDSCNYNFPLCKEMLLSLLLTHAFVMWLTTAEHTGNTEMVCGVAFPVFWILILSRQRKSPLGDDCRLTWHTSWPTAL